MRRRHEDPEIIILEEEGGSPLGWLLLGVALGAGVSLLFAPASGEETRRRLADRARQLRDQAEDTLDDLKERFEDVKDDLVEAAAEVKEVVRGVGRKRGEEATGDDGEDELELVGEEEEKEERPRRSRAESARAELERRLAAARARRRAAGVEDEEPVA
jgi:gas vesicle protein